MVFLQNRKEHESFSALRNLEVELHRGKAACAMIRSRACAKV